MLFSKPQINITGDTEKIDLIANQLCEHAKDYNSRCIVIVDPFIVPYKDDILDYFQKPNQIEQVLILHPAVVSWQRPILIELDLKNANEQDILRYTIAQSLKELEPKQIYNNSKRHYSGWIFTHSTIQKIAYRLATLSIQQIENQEFLLRFYDPAVLPQLLTVLNIWQQNKLCNLIGIWALLDGNGDLFTHYNPKITDLPSAGQLLLTQQQEDELHCIGINNQMLKEYRKENPTHKLNECDTLNHIKPSLLRLMSQGFKDEALLLEWAKIALNNSQNFDLYPELQEKIKMIKTRYEFNPLLKVLRQTDWQAELKV